MKVTGKLRVKVKVKAACARARARAHAHADAVHDADADADADAGADAGAYAHGRAYVHTSFPRFCHYPSLHTDKKPPKTVRRTQHVRASRDQVWLCQIQVIWVSRFVQKIDGNAPRGLWP